MRKKKCCKNCYFWGQEHEKLNSFDIKYCLRIGSKYLTAIDIEVLMATDIAIIDSIDKYSILTTKSDFYCKLFEVGNDKSYNN